jgi:2-dehydropantoate 2-reductase
MPTTAAMKVLVIGAGVIGSVYAGRLSGAGHEVTLLARGSRLDELRPSGLRLCRSGGPEVRARVTIASEPPAAAQDLVMLAVRREQAAAAAEQTAGIQATTVLLFGNYGGITADLAALAGRDRTIAGFPGAGGRVDGATVTYALIKAQPTAMGGLPGCDGNRAQVVAGALREAGFATSLEPDMDGWLGSHAALVVPMSAGIMAVGGSASALADRKDLLLRTTAATRAIYRAQRRARRLVINRNLRLLYLLMPGWFAARYWAGALRGEFGELAFAAHTRHAWSEMAALGAWLRSTLLDDQEAVRALDYVLGLATAFG